MRGRSRRPFPSFHLFLGIFQRRVVFILWALYITLIWNNNKQQCESKYLRVENASEDPTRTNIPNLVDSKITTLPLHAMDGTHHVYVYAGSPPQRQVLIVDTGSRLMAFPCEPCMNCGHHASKLYYDPHLSTTNLLSHCDYCHFTDLSKCTNNQCQFTQRYTEGSSLTAYEVEDLIWLGTENEGMSFDQNMQLAVPFTFGCQTAETGLFRTQYADGIIGLAMHDGSILNAFVKAGALQSNAFSLCMTRTGGALSLGGTSMTSRHLQPMKFTPLSKRHGWYAVAIQSVHVDDILVTINHFILDGFNADKGTIIDSGTTDAYLPKVVAGPFVEAWMARTNNRSYSNKLDGFTYEEFQSLPNIIFTLDGGLKWIVRPQSYMELADTGGPTTTTTTITEDIEKGEMLPPWTGKKYFTNRIYLDETKGCVLGGNIMFGHDILFDVDAQRIGIAPANCP